MPTVKVSIPFKRESGAKANTRSSQYSSTLVSIPFKRESVAKDQCSMIPVIW